jgi:hypothetical protein
MTQTYSVLVSYLDDEEIVEVAESPDGAVMRHLAELLALHAAEAVTEVMVLASGTLETVYLWRADGAGWISKPVLP